MNAISRKKLVNYLIFISLFLSFSDVLRQDIGYLSWTPLILTILLSIPFRQCSTRVLYFSFILFLFSVLLNSILADDPLNVAARAVKLSLIFAFSYVLMSNKNSVNLIVLSIKTILLLNSFFLLLGYFGYEYFAKVGGEFRWSTILSAPGVLYLSGAIYIIFFVFEFSNQNTFLIDKSILLKIFFSSAAILIIYSDGGKTSLVAIIFSILFLLGFRGNLLHTLKISLPILVTSFILISISNIDFFSDKISTDRFSAIFDSRSLESVDRERSDLMKSSFAWISQNNPIFIGKGFSTTILGDNFELVVHNGYLYVWEQLGIIGLIFFLQIIFLPFAECLRFLIKFRRQQYLLPSSILLFYAIILMFHPIATEYGPWIPYFIAISIIGKINTDSPPTTIAGK